MTTHGADGTTKSLPAHSFTFLDQLQDLLANTDIFDELDYLSLDRKESERFKTFVLNQDDVNNKSGGDAFHSGCRFLHSPAWASDPSPSRNGSF
jgi:hypothetical protein